MKANFNLKLLFTLFMVVHSYFFGFILKIEKSDNFLTDMLTDNSVIYPSNKIVDFFKSHFHFDFQNTNDLESQLRLILTTGNESFLFNNDKLSVISPAGIKLFAQNEISSILLANKNTINKLLTKSEIHNKDQYDRLINQLNNFYNDLLVYYVRSYVLMQYIFKKPKTEQDFKSMVKIEGNFNDEAQKLYDVINAEDIIDEAIGKFKTNSKLNTLVLSDTTSIKDLLLSKKNKLFKIGRAHV